MFTSGFKWSVCCSSFNCLCRVLYIIVCSYVPFLLAVVLSVHFRLTASDYPFGIFNLLCINNDNAMKYLQLAI